MISKNFTRCLAKLCGDGHIKSKYLRYNNTCQVLLDEFEEDIKKEFGDIHMTKGKVNSGTSFVQVHRKFVISKFLSYLDSFKSNDVRTPIFVLNSPIELKKEFIRAFYDDEGCATLRYFSSTDEWKRNITLSSNSLIILNEIKKMLLSFGIISNKIYRNKPLSSYDKSYVLSITGKKNFILFKEMIKFKHPRKIQVLDLIIESYDATPKRNSIKFLELKRKLNLCDPI